MYLKGKSMAEDTEPSKIDLSKEVAITTRHVVGLCNAPNPAGWLTASVYYNAASNCSSPSQGITCNMMDIVKWDDSNLPSGFVLDLSLQNYYLPTGWVEPETARYWLGNDCDGNTNPQVPNRVKIQKL
jgi:hypothetical protein